MANVIGFRLFAGLPIFAALGVAVLTVVSPELPMKAQASDVFLQPFARSALRSF